MADGRACRDNVPYLSEQCAMNAAFLINLRNATQEGHGQIQVPYRCPHCGDFHLTAGKAREPATAGAGRLEP